MPFRHALSRLSIAFIVAVGMLTAPPLVAPATAVEVLHDGGFEETVPGSTTNPWWEGFDSEYVEGPLCRPDNYCGGQGVSSRTGSGWVWLGGGWNGGQTGWVRQHVTIPAGTQATLGYWYRFAEVSAPFDAIFTVSLDGNALATYTEPLANQPEWVHEVVDVSAFADGHEHELEFAYAKPSDPPLAWTNLLLDDVSLDAADSSDATDATAPETTVSTAGVRDGVARSLTVPIRFEASEAGATFTCSLDGAAYAPCSSPAQVTVVPGRHVYRVIARDAAGNADPTPAEAAFTAYDCPALKSAVVALRTSVGLLKKRLMAVRRDLRVAWHAHDHDAAERLQAKVHRIEERRKAHRLALFQARNAYAPCLYS